MQPEAAKRIDFLHSLDWRGRGFFKKFGERVGSRKEVFVPAKLIFPASGDVSNDLKQLGDKGVGRGLLDPAVEFELRKRHGDALVEFFKQNYGVGKIDSGGARNLWRKGVWMTPFKR